MGEKGKKKAFTVLSAALPSRGGVCPVCFSLCQQTRPELRKMPLGLVEVQAVLDLLLCSLLFGLGSVLMS